MYPCLGVKLVVVRGTSGQGILAGVILFGCVLIVLDRRGATHAVTAKKPIETAELRAAGFNAKAEAKLVSANTVKSILSAGGPTHSNEVLRFEAETLLKKPNGTTQVIAARRSTFSPTLAETVVIPNLEKGSKIVVRGTIYVYRREDVKVEREMQPDGTPKLFLNTGYITFKPTQTPNGSRVLVTCTNLKSVHEHGIEFMGKDKKSVSARIMLTPGDQVMDRESVPFTSKQKGLEPITINQLIPKRTEPIELTVPISGL